MIAGAGSLVVVLRMKVTSLVPNSVSFKSPLLSLQLLDLHYLSKSAHYTVYIDIREMASLPWVSVVPNSKIGEPQ